MTKKPENQGQTTFSGDPKEQKTWSVPVLGVEDRGAVRILTMNRPEKRNALNSELTQRLLDAFRAADADESVGAIVLTGAGQGFCAGADLSEFKDLQAAVAAENRAELTMQLHLVFSKISKPIVTAINGHAMGGGAGLAIAGDLAVMADSAKLGYPEAKHGIVAAIVMANLVRQVGRKAAFELVSLGEPIDAQRALQLGMVNRVVSLSEVLDTARLAGRKARRGQTPRHGRNQAPVPRSRRPRARAGARARKRYQQTHAQFRAARQKMKPLDGLIILDLSRVLACPFASMILAELGARVIKVEQPGSGDETRSFEPQLAADSAYYFACNRSKESITVNLRSDEGRKLIRGLAQKADVVLENFPVGTLGALWAGFRRALRPQAGSHLCVLHRLRPDRPLRREEGIRHGVPGDGRHHEPDRRARRRSGEAGAAGRRPYFRPVDRHRHPRRARRAGAHRQRQLRRFLHA